MILWRVSCISQLRIHNQASIQDFFLGGEGVNDVQVVGYSVIECCMIPLGGGGVISGVGEPGTPPSV